MVIVKIKAKRLKSFNKRLTSTKTEIKTLRSVWSKELNSEE